MDSSHVSLVTLSLRKEGFSHFRCDSNMTMGLKIGSVSRILKCADGSDTITLKAEEDGDTLSFVFENEKADRISDFELKLIDLDADHLDIPEEECDATIRMPSGEFQRLCRDLNVLGDACSISVTKEGVRFSVEGDDGKGSVTLRPNDSADDKENIKIVMNQVIEQKFALRYLTMFTKATSLSSHVTMELANDRPLKIEYEIEGMGSLCFYLAPKMDDEE